MSQSFDDLMHFYQQLNRDHDRRRNELLSQITSSSTDEEPCGETLSWGQSSAQGGDERHSWLTRRGVELVVVLVVAVSVFVLMFSSPALTLAQVKEELGKQKWVMIKYDDGEENWISLHDGRRFWKLPSGRIFFSAPGVWQQYFPARFREDTWTVFQTEQGGPTSGGPGRIEEWRVSPEEMKGLPEWRSVSAWDFIVGKAEDQMTKPRTDLATPYRTERHLATVDGRQLVRFDTIYTDALENEKLHSQLWADPKTRLPVRSRKFKKELEAGGDVGGKYVNGEFAFPTEGPDDIYSLGVPREAVVNTIKRDRGATPKGEEFAAELERLLAHARNSVDRFPSRFRAVKWPAEKFTPFGGGEVHVLYWSGQPARQTMGGKSFLDWTNVQIRQTRYFVSDEVSLAHELNPPVDLPRILEWTALQEPVDIGLSDGRRTYCQNGQLHQSRQQAPPTMQVFRIRGDEHSFIPFNTACWPMDMYWPYLSTFGPGSHHEVINSPEKSEENVPGTILLRYTNKANQRADYYISPIHDYICVKQTWWKLEGNGVRKLTESTLADFRQLPNGRWWAARQTKLDFANPGITDRQSYLIDIITLEPNQFPPAVFDGAKLLEEAKRANARIIAE